MKFNFTGLNKPFLQMLELSHSDFVPEDIPPYTVVGPNLPERVVNVEGIVTPGEMGFMNYSRKGRAGQGAAVYVMKPSAEDGLDHDYLRHFVLVRGVKVIQRGSQTIITSDDGKVFLWKAGPRQYYYLAGGNPEVLDAYLKKFPSVLPRDYAFDREAWLKAEVRQMMERLAKSVAEDARNRYLTDYFYLCRFIEPIEGAVPIWDSFLPAKKLTTDERKAHFAPVDKWWKQHEKDFALRKGAPLSHGQMMALSPKDPKAVEAALNVIRASTQPATAPK